MHSHKRNKRDRASPLLGNREYPKFEVACPLCEKPGTVSAVVLWYYAGAQERFRFCITWILDFQSRDVQPVLVSIELIPNANRAISGFHSSTACSQSRT